jgi:hypothetical protein
MPRMYKSPKFSLNDTVPICLYLDNTSTIVKITTQASVNNEILKGGDILFLLFSGTDMVNNNIERQ